MPNSAPPDSAAASPIDFWFDFSSPFAYFMSERINAIAARYGRKVRWSPFLLGAVNKVLGTDPLPLIPMKGPYSLNDIARSARFLGLPYRKPDVFPLGTQQAARAFYFLKERDPTLARRFARATFRAYFVDNRDISQRPLIVELVAAAGGDGAALDAALDGEALKQRLRQACDTALATGVFGSPYIVIDGEPFWGVDRLPQIERWLESGGF